jgi:cobalt-zinc-cadmium efflux system membrane fusion protein
MTSTPGPLEANPRRTIGQRLWAGGQFVAALALTIGFLIYLLARPVSKSAIPEERTSPATDPVQIASPQLIRIDPASPLSRKLQIAEVHPVRVTAPVLTVTGTVVASLRPGSGKSDPKGLAAVAGLHVLTSKPGDFWQFNSPEVLTTFTDWQRASADIAFSRIQLGSVRELAQARLVAQQAVVDRLVKYVAAGTDARKDLDIANADLIQVRLQGNKDLHEAQTAVAKAIRDEAAAARQLQQAGLDPALLNSVTSDVDIVMADVPEGFLGRVKTGQGCEAVFFGVPDVKFTGRVRSIAPVVSKDRRSLRVLFTIDDLADRLRPGMYAEIGLGTDARDSLQAPAEGILHVGRTDYLLVGAGADQWRITPVEAGEVRGNHVEVLSGLTAGDKVLGAGAILLKPAVAKAVQNGGGP